MMRAHVVGRLKSILLCSAKQDPRPQLSKSEALVRFLGVATVAGAAAYGVSEHMLRNTSKRLEAAKSIRNEWDHDWDSFLDIDRRASYGEDNYLLPHWEYVLDRKNKEAKHNCGRRSIIIIVQPTDGKPGLQDTTKKTLKSLCSGVNSVNAVYVSRLASEWKESLKRLLGQPETDVFELDELEESFPEVPSPTPEKYAKSDIVSPADVEQHRRRAEKAFRTLFSAPFGEGENVSCDVVVAGGNTARYLICRALQIDPSFWIRFGAQSETVYHLMVDKNGCVTLVDIATRCS